MTDAAIIVVPDEARADDITYGLGGSVYTRDLERGHRVAEAIEAGMVYINHPAFTYEDMSFCGIKKFVMKFVHLLTPWWNLSRLSLN